MGCRSDQAGMGYRYRDSQAGLGCRLGQAGMGCRCGQAGMGCCRVSALTFVSLGRLRFFYYTMLYPWLFSVRWANIPEPVPLSRKILTFEY